MPDKEAGPTDPFCQRRMALSKWESEGGTEPAPMQRGSPSGAELSHVPPLTDAELIHLRIRVIALENMVISLLAQASSQQLDLAREMATYISPRPGFTQHPLTVRAAHQMIDLVERTGHFLGAAAT
jgi:hypothetical protein